MSLFLYFCEFQSKDHRVFGFTSFFPLYCVYPLAGVTVVSGDAGNDGMSHFICFIPQYTDAIIF